MASGLADWRVCVSEVTGRLERKAGLRKKGRDNRAGSRVAAPGRACTCLKGGLLKPRGVRAQVGTRDKFRLIGGGRGGATPCMCVDREEGPTWVTTASTQKRIVQNKQELSFWPSFKFLSKAAATLTNETSEGSMLCKYESTGCPRDIWLASTMARAFLALTPTWWNELPEETIGENDLVSRLKAGNYCSRH
ncbi:uncharacterized protein LOC143823940 [Paroedura picta]|uniref:uncharacterized protein LOC143823940 n=1 Tax=Paroedura picta TaxID=143630 RepID=UPI004057BB09